MNPVLATLESFSAAEEFLNYLGVDYDPSVVHVNRLHILKRFNQYLNQSPVSDNLTEAEALASCKSLLTQAYSDFVKSNAAQEKVFKVFQDQDGQSVSLQKVKTALRDRGQA